MFSQKNSSYKLIKLIQKPLLKPLNDALMLFLWFKGSYMALHKTTNIPTTYSNRVEKTIKALEVSFIPPIYYQQRKPEKFTKLKN